MYRPLRVLGEQRGASSHAALSRARAAAAATAAAAGESGADKSVSNGYVDMSQSAQSANDAEAAAKLREDDNRKRLGEALTTIAADKSGHYYNLLLVMIEAPAAPAEVRDLVWKVLMQLPTLRSKYCSIQEQQFTRWSGVLGPETGPWRSLYALQIVDAMLLPGDDVEQLRHAVEWRRRFLGTGGLEQLIVFAMTVDKHPSWHHPDALARSVCLPLLARILKSCVAGALSDLKTLHASSGAGGACGGRSLGIPPSPGSRPLSSPMLASGEEKTMSLSALHDRSELYHGERRVGSGGGEMVIDMGLMTRQLLSFLLQDLVADSEEARVAHTHALTDGLAVIRQLLCAGGAGTPSLLPHSDNTGASITIGHSIIETFFNKGCADDVIDGILLRHPQQSVRCRFQISKVSTLVVRFRLCLCMCV